MAKLLPYVRLALLASLTSLALTSCFDHDKKCDPQPKNCSGSHSGTNTGTGGPS